MPSGTRVLLLLDGGLMPLDSGELVHLAAFKLELERLETVSSDKDDVEYKIVTRWLRNRVSEIERR